MSDRGERRRRTEVVVSGRVRTRRQVERPLSPTWIDILTWIKGPHYIEKREQSGRWKKRHPFDCGRKQCPTCRDPDSARARLVRQEANQLGGWDEP